MKEDPLDILEIDNYVDSNQFFMYYVICISFIIIGSFYNLWFLYMAIVPLMNINMLGFGMFDRNSPTLYVNVAYIIALSKPLVLLFKK